MAFMRATSVHNCPAPDCSLRVPNRFYACRFDWYRLPPALKAAITSTARSPLLSPERRQALTDAARWYADNPRTPVASS